ncbi:unnamed protein product [Clavelina lepadiformis]|uniref:Right handed beta helix domain-containing protein n=1 Tax=Clavelina lepadiformis TaxID=159417 RepID=A0ABP0F9W2_CLALP
MTVRVSSHEACPSRSPSSLTTKKFRKSNRFYLDAENGNDGWSGKKSTPEEGAGPFKTFLGAINGIREHRTSLRKNVVLFVRQGIYFLSPTIILDERDERLSIVGYPGDKRPVISGAAKIPGSEFFMFDQDKYVARFSGKCSKHVFLGDKRLIRARKPNLNKWTGKDMTGEGPYLTIKDLLRPSEACDRQGSGGFRQTTCHLDNRNGFVFEKGDVNLNWTKPSAGDILIFEAWTAERGHIKNISSANKLQFTEPLRFPIGEHPMSSGWRYIVENIFEELDSTGEFFCDEEAQLLYLIPPEDALLDEDVFVASEDTFFIVENTKIIRFLDLEFRHSHDRNFAGYNQKPGVIQFEFTNNVLVERCLFSNIGYTGIVVDNSCTNVIIRKNKFSDVGYFAITSGSETKNLRIHKNTFEGCGVSNMFQPSCIFVQGSANIKVFDNKVSKTSYAGMRIGWQPTFSEDFVPSGQYVFQILGNDVSDIGMGILNDFGGIYLSSNPGCSGPNAILSNCHLHARVAFNIIHHASAYLYGGLGVYGDTAVSSLRVEKNWLYDLDGAAINFHCGQNNFALNNMIYHISDGRVFGTCNPIVGGGVLLQQDLTFKKNVVYVTDINARMWRPADEWTFEVPDVDKNIYYFNPFSQDQLDQFFPKGVSFQQWKDDTFNDLNSVIDDPLFKNIKQRDFSLRGTSFASQIGIQSINLRKVRRSSGIC